MLFGFDTNILILRIPAILLAFTIHEFFHGYVAFCLGDNTAKWQGRLTLNPIKHLDPLGAIMLLLGGFGWAKAVPVNPYNLRHPKRDMALIALAGPVSNFVLAFFALFIFMFLAAVGWLGASTVSMYFVLFFFQLFVVNMGLGLFNLIPMPPLDGSKILAAFLPHHLYWSYTNFRYGFPILILLVMGPQFGINTGINLILGVPMDAFFRGYSFVIERFLGLFF